MRNRFAAVDYNGQQCSSEVQWRIRAPFPRRGERCPSAKWSGVEWIADGVAVGRKSSTC